ncbi:DNA cytosine methyltransferase [Corynebacterium aquatimens]|uniref:Cytosine-specific methyltransferase n=1 Tax=Corynebacterium aquatimens TaxID=1190508 RepID=A0A931DZ19_9CORY|nr:DNA cytosine methyltransferase [Corynebacterium aquatimens]MBG6121313.1 DNA (cytosine-5)-methyltransferase 1 [Corynebacterium aquatimens]WJY66137.1 Modification methylase HaeIII [Corynebacterium aquatimens]
MSINVVDLFSGAGGISQGFTEASEQFAIVRAIDSDLDAAMTFEQNFQSANVVHADIEDWLQDARIESCDVVVGGPPCQGFSSLGKIDEKKNRLWENYARYVRESQPSYFVMENVPQFAKSPQKAVFETELSNGLLKDYSARTYLVNSADYGTHQLRRRMIILGTRKDRAVLRMPAPLLFEDGFLTVRDAFKDLPPCVTETDLPDRYTERQGVKRPGPFTTKELHLTRRYQEISLRRFSEIPPGGNRFDLPDELLAPCWRKHTSGSGDVMGRLHWDQPSVTIRTEFNKPEKGRYLHPEENRAITHHEAARLMGFPDNYKWVGSKTSIARQIGNAVPIPLARSVGVSVAALFA